MPRKTLFIILDQMRADCVFGALANAVPLPRIRGLAAQGVSFRRHYSVANPCGPARASLLTGLYPMTHRSVRNGTPLADHHTNLAQEVRKAGVRPMLFGYTDTTRDPRRFHRADPILSTYEQVMPGFDEVLEMRFEESWPWRAHLKARGYDLPAYGDFYTPVSPDPSRPPRIADPAFYRAEDSDTAFLTDRFLEHMSLRTDQAWFAMLTYIRPHPPFVAPVPWNTLVSPSDVPPPLRRTAPKDEMSRHPFFAACLDEAPPGRMAKGVRGIDHDLDSVQALRAVYLGLAAEVDQHVGRIFDWLHDTGQDDETLVILTSDHGEMLGDHHAWGKMNVYDPAWHVPMILRAPSSVMTRAGAAVDAFTESIDLAPTVLDWLGVRVPAAMDGRSLLTFLSGAHVDDWRDYAYAELDIGDPESPTPWQDQMGLALREANLSILREERWKVVHFNGGHPLLLFDMERDPGEMENLAQEPAHLPTLLRLTQRLLDHRMRHADHAISDVKIDAGRMVNF
jgi:arylsulfatase A-like enzyme